MAVQELLAWGTGVTFLLLLFGTALFILTRKVDAPVSGEAGRVNDFETTRFRI
jgi:hypothetical protein